MKVIVLKSFPYSHNGIHGETMVAGPDGQEVRDDLVPGLAAAGYVSHPPENKALPVAPENMALPSPEEAVPAEATVPRRGRWKR